MSLARAFTTRRAKGKLFGGDGEADDNKPRRMNTVKGQISAKISGPVELVHTTNMLSYNAPDIRKGPKISAPVQLISTTNMLSYDAPDILKEPKTAVSTSSLSTRSEVDSENPQTAASSPPTSPDSAFPRGVLGSKGDDEKPAIPANHLSSYFVLPGQTTATDVPEVPAILKRAPSLSAKANEQVTRKMSLAERVGRKPSLSRLSEQSGRSVSSKASGPFSRASSASTSTTASSHQSTLSSHHAPKTSAMSPPPVPTAMERAGSKEASPFSSELAQVTELAEEYATRATEKRQPQVIITPEEQDFADRGLVKFTAEEYLAEIQSLFTTFLGSGGEPLKHAKSTAPQWI